MFRLYLLLYVTSLKICFSRQKQLTTNSTTLYDGKAWVPRVVNGWPAVLGDVPYQIAFKVLTSRVSNRYTTFCGGVIINPKKLLTAAHCFENTGSNCKNMFSRGPIEGQQRMVSATYAVAGNLLNRATYSKDSETNGQWRRLRSVVYPKSYKFPKDDIAVAVTRESFNFTEYVNQIPVAIKHVDYSGKCLVSGFGRISPYETSEKLLLAHLDLMSIRTCSIIRRKNMKHFICTSIAYTDVAEGDSGGPLVCAKTGDPKEESKGVLVGIVSGTWRGQNSFFTRSGVVRVALTNIFGEQVKLGELPHHVMIYRLYNKWKLEYRAYCAGSIITEYRIITSAKCFLTNRKRRRYNFNEIRIAGGILRTFAQEPVKDNAEQWRRVKKVYSQRSYRFPKYSLAVVETYKPWIYNQFVKNIPYASMDQDFDGVCVSTTVKATQSWSKSKHVFFEEVKLITRSKCERILLRSCYQYICTYDTSNTLAFSETIGSGLICHGTGDPKEVDKRQGILVGVTSIVNVDLPSLHNRVGLFNRWITDACTKKDMKLILLAFCVFAPLLRSGVYIE